MMIPPAALSCMPTLAAAAMFTHRFMPLRWVIVILGAGFLFVSVAGVVGLILWLSLKKK